MTYPPTVLDTPAVLAALPLLQQPRTFGELVGHAHPLVVHFPIAFLLLALLVEAAALARRRPTYGPTARLLVLSGAVAAVPAAVCGWLLSLELAHGGSLAPIFERHRVLGIVAALTAVAAAVVAEASRRPEGAVVLRRLYLVLLLVAAVAVSWAGHQGGALSYGPDFFSIR